MRHGISSPELTLSRKLIVSQFPQEPATDVAESDTASCFEDHCPPCMTPDESDESFDDDDLNEEGVSISSQPPTQRTGQILNPDVPVDTNIDKSNVPKQISAEDSDLYASTESERLARYELWQSLHPSLRDAAQQSRKESQSGVNEKTTNILWFLSQEKTPKREIEDSDEVFDASRDRGKERRCSRSPCLLQNQNCECDDEDSMTQSARQRRATDKRILERLKHMASSQQPPEYGSLRGAGVSAAQYEKERAQRYDCYWTSCSDPDSKSFATALADSHVTNTKDEVQRHGAAADSDLEWRDRFTPTPISTRRLTSTHADPAIVMSRVDQELFAKQAANQYYQTMRGRGRLGFLSRG